MHLFKNFLDALDCPGGHILLAILLGITGVGVVFFAELYELPKTASAAGQLLTFFSIATYAMRGRDKANGKGEEKLKE